MILAIVLIVFFGSIIFLTVKEDENLLDAMGFSLVPALLTLFVCSMIFLGSLSFTQPTVEIKKNIYTLGDNTSTTGRFFLGGGSVETGPAYMYYTKNADGSYRSGLVEAAGVSVFEHDEIAQPYMVKECDDNGEDPHNVWIWPMPMYSDGMRYTGCDIVEFHIPTGSVSQNYLLDAS